MTYKKKIEEDLFQIFKSQEELSADNERIDSLLGYPNENTKTYRYRNYDQIKHPISGLWAGIVSAELTKACKKMKPEKKEKYYKKDHLKTKKWMEDNGWFPLPPGAV